MIDTHSFFDATSLVMSREVQQSDPTCCATKLEIHTEHGSHWITIFSKKSLSIVIGEENK